MKRSLFQKGPSVDVDLINLTPLIDVVFVVLVSFILIAPLLQMDSVELSQKGETQKESFHPKNGAISLFVKKDNTIWFQETQISLFSLEKRLEKERKETEVFLFPDKNASFGTYQEIKNLLEKMGFSTLKVVLKS